MRNLCYSLRAVRIDAFDFSLPQERIAQHPCEPRDASRMLVVDPCVSSFTNRTVRDLPEWIEPGSLLILNDTRVIPARLLGRKRSTGGKVELLLVRRSESSDAQGDDSCSVEIWRALGKSSKPLRFPAEILVGDDESLGVTVLGRSEEDGLLDVRLRATDGSRVRDLLQRLGHVPLPPYIHRPDGPDDAGRYQTVYAKTDGAVAAPTAGLHLTGELLEVLRSRDVRIATVTLHVGLGTFQPVQVDDLDDHPMHKEWFDVPDATVREVQSARQRRARVVAVGTTTVRTLESAADDDHPGLVRPGHGTTRLLIQPGYQFRVVDAMLTNFHLPRSTLLALVSAFAGRHKILAAYQHAVDQGYRFYSYGDAMFICRRSDVAGDQP